ncbi:hypothetical protein C0585_03630 [Candidatus Woesearchaeota archaeon]|nr:MAG: hypothetical protein C0585_03630 [Candidatus Woesearchaeota archaeon]
MAEEVIAIKEALDNEKKGYHMYLDASTNSDSKIVRDLFTYLASQELIHIQRIEEFNKTLGTKVFFEVNMGDNISHFDEAKELFKKKVSEWKEEFKSDDDIKVLKTALEFEKSGYDFYKKHYEITEDDQAKKFYHFLMKEEDMHYHFIQNMISYIENPEQFNMDQEDWFFEG